MNSPFLLGYALVSLLLCAALAPAAQGAAPPPERPNIVVIFTDDQQFRAIGYDNPVVQTPNLDRLALAGVIFDRAYIATPICMASRASMMTGLFPQEHGAVALDTASFIKNIIQEKRYPTLPQVLRGAGYATAFCGKSHLGPPRDYGFEFGEEHRESNDNTTFAFAADFIGGRAARERPFFLWVAPHQPHVPLLPEPVWVERYAGVDIPVDPNFRMQPPPGSIYNQGLPGEQYYRDSDYRKNYKEMAAGPPRTEEEVRTFTRGYYATITRLDDQMGTLVQQLKDAGSYENTLIIFLSDNGYMLGNHGLGNKITMHEESVRVPMFIHGPRLPKHGLRCAALVSSLDVFPTVLELAGVAKPERLSGVSLLPLLENPGGGVREYVASECVGVNGVVGTGHRMVRTARWKYVLTGVNEEYLFDETADPYELRNVAGDPANAAVLSELRGDMGEWMAHVRDGHTLPPQ